MKTIEELLRPRYKVCQEGYPDMPFKPEAIIELNGFDEKHVPGQYFYLTQKGQANWYESFFDRFPNIFRKLDWSEERTREDLPDYVKFVSDGEVAKILRYEFIGSMCYIMLSKSWKCNITEDVLPATEDEYLAYKKSKE